MKNKYTIGQIAEITNLSTKAIRIYEEKGLIESKRDENNNYRYFDDSVKLELQRIQTLKFLGFSLEEISRMLIHFNNVNIEESFLEQKKLLEKKSFEINRMIHCMDKAAKECKDNKLDIDELFKTLNFIIIDRKADEGVGFLRKHTTNEPEGWSRWIFDQVSMSDDMKILDAGCGYGNLWRYNIERLPKGCRITCMDKHNTHADDFYIDCFKNQKNWNISLCDNKLDDEKSNTVFSFLWEDMEEYKFHDKYDVIFFNHVMIFIENKECLLKKLKGNLADSGVFCCTWGGTRLYDEIEKLIIEFKSEDKKIVHDMIEKKKRPILEFENVVRNVFKNVDKRIRELRLEYDNVKDLADYIKEICSKMGYDLSKYEEEFLGFLTKKYDKEDISIIRDGYMFICK